MSGTHRILGLFAALGASAALVACGDDGSLGAGDSTAPGEQVTVTDPPAAVTEGATTKADADAGRGVEVKVAGSQFGQILFDGNDQAIYLFDKESGPASECYGECAAAWPPVLTKGDPQAGKGAAAGKLGTTKRTDGTTQVTYNGHPLYYYVDDPPGQVLCQGVDEFGGLWLVVDAAGDAVS